MLKMLLLAGALVVLAWMLGGALRKWRAGLGTSKAPRSLPQAIVACARCGVHVPRAEVVIGLDARPYCSAAHRDAGPAG